MKVADLTRFSEILEFCECRSQNPFVSPVFAWTAKRATHRMIDKDGPRRRDSGHDVQHRADD
jgi:hypothetical protein